MRRLFLIVIVLFELLLSAVTVWAQATETVLYDFTDGSEGGNPQAGLVFDKVGNLYGTTSSGGIYDQGTVFELSPSNGTWTETVLYSFTGRDDGGTPTAPLILDANGNLYGTTQDGGTANNGVVFELHQEGDPWHEVVLHNFGAGGGDGDHPSGLFLDKNGRAFGTTSNGGVHGAGTVFAMQYSRGTWQYATLYSFQTGGTDGLNPQSGVVVDSNDRIYGTTPYGGFGRGTVFELKYSASGWKETIIYDFEGGADGTTPFAGLTLDSADNLYGTTAQGGANNDGTVFELSPSAQGWSKAIIYNASDAISALNTGVLTFDRFGNLYGETEHAIFELTPSDGGWSASLVFQFDDTDGYWPNGSIILDQLGNLYGTTVYGGSPFGVGVAFEIAP